VSRLCEEFHCLPSQAAAELATEYGWEALEIMEARAYAHAKARFDAAKSAEDLPDTPVMELVKDIAFDLAREAMERAKAEQS